MDTLTQGFNDSQEKYQVMWEYVPMTEFSKKLSMGYTENVLPDMVLIDNPDMPTGIKTGLFVEITDIAKELCMQEEYYPAVLETVYDGETCYGLPLNCNNLALICIDGLDIYLTHGNEYSLEKNKKFDRKGILVYGHEHIPYRQNSDARMTQV